MPYVLCNQFHQMNQRIQKLGRFGILLLGLSCQQAFACEESTFSKALVPGAYLIPAAAGNWNWCMAPIYDEKGKLHVFNWVIPNNGSWIKTIRPPTTRRQNRRGLIRFKASHLPARNRLKLCGVASQHETN
jgi:hypothetical protein